MCMVSSLERRSERDGGRRELACKQTESKTVGEREGRMGRQFRKGGERETECWCERTEADADNDGLLTGGEGERREENWERKPEWQHKSGGKKNGRGVGRERREERRGNA